MGNLRKRLTAVWLLSVLFSALFMTDSFVQAQPSETVKDKKHGIRFKSAKDWVSIPVEPNNKLTLYKFQYKRADRAKKHPGVAMTACLELLFFPIKSSETGSKTTPGASSTKTKDKKAETKKREEFRNYREFIDKIMIKQKKGKFKGKPKTRKTKDGSLTNYSVIYPMTISGRHELPVRILSAATETMHGDFVMQFTCLDEHFKRHKKDMESMARSLGFIEREKSGDKEKRFAELSKNERYIQEQIDKLSSGWYHFWSKDKNYMIFSNADKKFAKKISHNLETIHGCFVKDYPGEAKIKWIPIVRVCKTKNEYHGYGGPQGSAGYWSDDSKEFVFYDDVARGEKNSLIVLRHEAFHQFIHFFLGCRPSTWFDEGSADYYSGFDTTKKNIKVKPSQWRRGTIQTALVKKSHVPLRKFVKLSKSQYYANASLCYAQGWSFIYFLREARRQGAKVHKKWLEIPDSYLKNLQEAFAELEVKEPSKKCDPDEVNSELSNDAVKIAMTKTFKDWTDRDWDQMEKAWIDFIK